MIYLLIIPLFRGISNLDQTYVVECLGQSVSLVGIILITPVLKPEQNRIIYELMYLKQYAKCIFIRLVFSLIIIFVEITVFISVMLLLNCTFEYVQALVGTFISAMTLGVIGFLSYSISNNIIMGYIVSAGFYLYNFLTITHNKQGFHLFATISGDSCAKCFFFILSIVGMLIGVLIKTKKSC